MPFDDYLAERIRIALARIPNVTEKRMMGGMCFMVDDKMCINVTRVGDIMQRCLPGKTEELLKHQGVKRFTMNGKPLKSGWLRVSAEAVDKDSDLNYWIKIAIEGNKMAKPKGRNKE